MKVHQALDQLPKFNNAVVTIGSFDGVHCGHQKIIQKVKQLAQRVEGESILITFHPHPRQVIYPKDQSLKLITTIEEKVRLFEQFGLDHVVIVPFTIEFSQMSADEYIQKFLTDKFNPKYIVIGYDHRFGLNRQGDINYLQHHGQRAGFKVVEIPKQEVDDIAVSSTKIRKALDIGDVKNAQLLLGHYFTLSGKVVHGQKIGNTLGFPTANIDLKNKFKLVPPNGIYAVHIHWDGEVYDGMLYIGNRPTIKEHNNQTIEVNIFDFNQNIYGEVLVVELVSYIRDDMQLESLDELKKQLLSDKKKTEEIFQKQQSQPAINSRLVLPEVAIVILNYNGKGHLEKFLPSVQKSLYDNLEIIVADNGSTDDSVAFLQKNYPQVKCLQLTTNYGFAEGYNQALELVDADYYVLLNSDVEVPTDWVRPLISYMENNQEVAACQPKIKAYHQKDTFEYAGAAGGWLDSLGYPFCRGRIFDFVEKDNGQYDQNSEIFWASGAALVIRAPLFHKIGGFDGDYFAHAEEIDLCWRLKRAGYKIEVVSDSEVYHVGGGTLEYNTPRKAFLNFRNSLFTLLKNEPVEKLIWLLPLRLIMDALAGVLFLSQGKFQHIISIIKAHWSFLGGAGKAWQKRRFYNQRIKSVRIGPANTGAIFRGSIVWQYYGLGKKRFYQLEETRIVEKPES
ncbi:MAG: hypothetical protein DHS20C18_09520 [Saprospiraceae bacterium]|nr:MAG: hypothetical protein DHS20C18_09520 [Saprospiraceae bacterium]